MQYVIIDELNQKVLYMTFEQLETFKKEMNIVLDENFSEFVTFEQEKKIALLDINEIYNISDVFIIKRIK